MEFFTLMFLFLYHHRLYNPNFLPQANYPSHIYKPVIVISPLWYHFFIFFIFFIPTKIERFKDFVSAIIFWILQNINKTKMIKINHLHWIRGTLRIICYCLNNNHKCAYEYLHRRSVISLSKHKFIFLFKKKSSLFRFTRHLMLFHFL